MGPADRSVHAGRRRREDNISPHGAMGWQLSRTAGSFSITPAATRRWTTSVRSFTRSARKTGWPSHQGGDASALARESRAKVVRAHGHPMVWGVPKGRVIDGKPAVTPTCSAPSGMPVAAGPDAMGAIPIQPSGERYRDYSANQRHQLRRSAHGRAGSTESAVHRVGGCLWWPGWSFARVKYVFDPVAKRYQMAREVPALMLRADLKAAWLRSSRISG